MAPLQDNYSPTAGPYGPWYTLKTRAAKRLLEDGHSVRLSVRYRGRERTHPEKAREQLDAILPALADVAQFLGPVTSDARSMSVLLGPRKTQ